MFDLLFKNAQIYDGTGAPAFMGEVAVADGKIVQVGSGLGPARREIDCKGMALSPGFIDSHSHADTAIFAYPEREHVLRMGVTTEVAGNCGHSLFGLKSTVTEEEEITLHGAVGSGFTFETLKEYREAIEKLPLGVNMSVLTGHCSLRCSAMGLANREPSEGELQEMKRLLVEAMKDGAQGYSSGLGYIPSVFSKEAELVEIAKAVAPYHGIYTTHSRYESASILKSINETIHISREAGVLGEISHLKCTGKDFWHLCDNVLATIEEANRNGAHVAFDAYPYAACSTSIGTAALPPRFFDQGMNGFIERIKDPAVVEEIRREIYEIDDPSWDNAVLHVGPENFLIVTARKTPEIVGKSYAQLAEEWGMEPLDAMLKVLVDNDGLVTEVRYTMCEENIEAILKHPLCTVGADGIYIKGVSTLAHPRAFGTFPRFLGRYVRDRKIMSRAEGIHRITGKPAVRFGLAGKGFIRPGYDADLVLFDYDTILDHADYMDPFKLNEGIHQVYIDGKLVLEDNESTGTYVGRFVPRTPLE